MNTILNFKEITGRLEDFVDYFMKTAVDNLNLCKENHITPSKTKTEEELYRLFLNTHFQSSDSAKKFINLMNWEKLNTTGNSKLEKVCQDFFTQSDINFGDHRRHISFMSHDKRATYTFETLISYKAVIKKHGSQKQFFRISENPDFDELYNKMVDIDHFESRLPRFDHLEKVSRTFNFYCTPTRFYVEDATGPLDGLTYLILGEKLRKSKTRLKEIILNSDFVQKWNSSVKSKYQLTDRESCDSTLQKFEQWTIDTVRQKLPKSQQKNPAFVFDLETNLCNWQKKKQIPNKIY